MKTIKIILVMIMVMTCGSMSAQRYSWGNVRAEIRHRETVRAIERNTEAVKRFSDYGYTRIGGSYIPPLPKLRHYSDSLICGQVYALDLANCKKIETDSVMNGYIFYYINGHDYTGYPTKQNVMKHVLTKDLFSDVFNIHCDYKHGKHTRAEKKQEKLEYEHFMWVNKNAKDLTVEELGAEIERLNNYIKKYAKDFRN